jgi:hypothetical protein
VRSVRWAKKVLAMLCLEIWYGVDIFDMRDNFVLRRQKIRFVRFRLMKIIRGQQQTAEPLSYLIRNGRQ